MSSSLHRREFIGRAGNLALLFLAGPNLLADSLRKGGGEFLFLEAEGFADQGGWALDQQSMEQMGSPYLLAHGLGIPVADARTQAVFPSAGTYRVWVRTRDWVAPWQAPGAPGKFQLIVDGQPLSTLFGTEGADWHWQDGGTVTVKKKATVALHDLTGFEGRCEAILFCKDLDFVPVNELEALTRFRRALLGLPEHPDDGGTFDLVVVGGGLAGTCAAVSAARNGLKVALVQDRPVLGGNGSSEVRVWPEGNTNVPPYPHVGDIVKELLPERPEVRGSLNARDASLYDDPRKLAVVRRETGIRLLLEQRAVAVEGTRDLIHAVIIQNVRTARQTRLRARLFADCTGDATIGFLAGADYEFSRQNHMGTSNLWNLTDTPDAKALLDCNCKDKSALGLACELHNVPQPFPRCPWAMDLSDRPFPGRKKFSQGRGQDDLSQLGAWFWESGFALDPVADIERIRDLNLRAMYGAWDALKNVDHLYPNLRLGWAAFIAGKRESRRLMGDVVLRAKDFLDQRNFADGAFPCSWHIDLHSADNRYDKDMAGDAFISVYTHGKGYTYQGPFWAPYRCLYSRNINNLFMAGRNISVSSDGLGPVRVMRTCGMMGEIVGKAAAICVRHNSRPRDVYDQHLAELKSLMNEPGSRPV